MLIYRDINRQTVRIVLNWGKDSHISWKATLSNRKEDIIGVTYDKYDSLVEAIPEIETMVEINMDDIASGDYENPTTILNVAFRSDRLRQLRHARKISAKQVAHRADITTYHVYRLERGERPHVWGTTVAKLALALGTSTDYLLGITDDPSSLENLKITEYELLYDKKSLRSVVLQLRRGRGSERWLISRANDCLGKTPNAHGYFTFEFEPLPSSRDDDYYRDHRFDSAEEAHEFWTENRNKILATYDERLEFVRMTRGISHI